MLGVFQPTFGFVLEQIRLQGFCFFVGGKTRKIARKTSWAFFVARFNVFPYLCQQLSNTVVVEELRSNWRK